MKDTKINSTLCYIEKEQQYLMLYRNKKKNDPCEGKWVGVGGKFEPGESPEMCLLREVREETGLELTEYRFCGIVHFVSDTWPDEDMYLYTASAFRGEDRFAHWRQERNAFDMQGEDSGSFFCDEGDLMWIPKEEILHLRLWEGDKYFLEPLIHGDTDIHMTCTYQGHTCTQVRDHRKESAQSPA